MGVDLLNDLVVYTCFFFILECGNTRTILPLGCADKTCDETRHSQLKVIIKMVSWHPYLYYFTIYINVCYHTSEENPHFKI